MSAPEGPLREQVSHVADFLRRYPGDTVTFFTRARMSEPALGFTFRIVLPAGLRLEDARSEDLPSGLLPVVYQDAGETKLVWNVEPEMCARQLIEIEVHATVNPVQEDCTLEARSILVANRSDGNPVQVEESAHVLVQAKGRYLKYLPGIYQDDQLMGRFLMLFESFLSPLEKKIDSQPDYLDPRLTPKQFLPWLASWTGMPLEDEIDEPAQRNLVMKASRLMHERGTRAGLQEYLADYTGGQVHIIEHFSDNFRIGPDAKLGLGIALGTDNIPNTFSIYIQAPERGEGASEEARLLHNQALEHRISSIIEAEKPAHTGYTLHLEIEPAKDSNR
jgi:phage tail-like protein